jgi:tetratricopeptide (TPR) repeat protein
MKRFVLVLILVLPMLSSAQDSTDELLAAQYFRQGEFDKAAALYETLVENNPTAVVYQNYLECLFHLDDFRKAERFVKSRIKSFPDEISFEVDLGWVLDRWGKNRDAQRHFNRLVSSLKANSSQIEALAQAFENRGYLDLALETYNRGRRLLGTNHQLHLKIAALQERRRDFVSMMNEYIDYLEINRASEERVMGMLQDAIANDTNFEKNDALRSVLLTRTQREPSNIMYSKMLLWLTIQQKDFRIAFTQARALDRRLRQEGELVLDVAQLASVNSEYTVAADAFKYLLDKGVGSTYYLDAKVGLLNVRFRQVTSAYQFDKKDLMQVEKEYKMAIEELGISAQTVSLVRNLAHIQAFYLGNSKEAIEGLNNTLTLPGMNQRTIAECRIELADILLLSGQVWDATLLYSQVDKALRDNPLAHEAKFKNARLSFYIGEFDWAKAQLDVLKAGTSRLIANDAIKLSLRIQDNIGFDQDTRPLKMYASAEMLTFMNRFDEAIVVLDSLSLSFPTHQIVDDVLMARAEISLARGMYLEADSLLALIVKDYPRGLLADEALFKRAELHERVFSNPEKARELYFQLLTTYPASLNSVTARNRWRDLREPL